MIDLAPNFSGCDKEPIHIPGSIQPHGILLVAETGSLIVRHGAGDIEGAFRRPDFAGRRLADLLGDGVAREAALVSKTASQRAFIATVALPNGLRFDVTAHIAGMHLIVELEPINTEPKSSNQMLGVIEGSSSAFDRASTLKKLCDTAAVHFRELTQYDRVMIYRFLDNGAGLVLAEDKRSDMHSFLNHHFPGSDIPQQARALYVRNLLRVIPNVNYNAMPLRPPWTDMTPLDMSDCILRSVSPVHVQYLKNMGVLASASISLVKDGVLWGLIACHNETPKIISYDIRAACRTLASSLARQIKMREEADAYRERLYLHGAQDKAITLLSRGTPFNEHDLQHEHAQILFDVLPSDGFAIVRREKILLTGTCPPEESVRKLVGWLVKNSVETVFSTDELIGVYPDARSFQETGAGVLAILLSVEDQSLLIWFRSGEVQVVKWAGNPHKDTELKPGEVLSPRASFEAWQETVRGRSRKWTSAEVEAANRIRLELLEVLQSQRLRELNRQLIETVADKDLLLNQKQFLIGEINHRVQNSLQIVSGFLSLQARNSIDSDFREAVEEARSRISAISLLHRSLYQSEEIGVTDAGKYIKDICDNLVGSMGHEWKPHFSLHLSPVMLPIDRVIPLGLTVTELIININKYAYSGAPGPVEIELVEDHARFRLVVADRGRGRATTRQGFGTRMMSALVSQLSGTLEYEDNTPGLRVILSAPIQH